MKAFMILSICVASSLAASYGYGQRAEIPAPVRAPTEAPMASYGSYDQSYQAPTTKFPRMHIPIVRLEQNSDNQGKYDSLFESGNGIKQTEVGVLKDLGDKEGPVNVKSGSYSYTGPDQKSYSVQWTSDEKGFVATGDHFPTPHPIPAEIQKSLELNRLEEEKLAREGKLPIPEEEQAAPLKSAPSSYGSSYSSYAAPAPAPAPVRTPVRAPVRAPVAAPVAVRIEQPVSYGPAKYEAPAPVRSSYAAPAPVRTPQRAPY